MAKLGVIGNQDLRILEKSHWITFPSEISEHHNLPEITTEPVIHFENQVVAWCESKAINFLKNDGEFNRYGVTFCIRM